MVGIVIDRNRLHPDLVNSGLEDEQIAEIAGRVKTAAEWQSAEFGLLRDAFNAGADATERTGDAFKASKLREAAEHFNNLSKAWDKFSKVGLIVELMHTEDADALDIAAAIFKENISDRFKAAVTSGAVKIASKAPIPNPALKAIFVGGVGFTAFVAANEIDPSGAVVKFL